MAMTSTGMTHEAVFLAGSATELDRAAELLDAHGISFTTRRSSFVLPFPAGAVREGVAFHVLARQAAFCREALADHGLARGVLPVGAEETARVGELTSV